MALMNLEERNSKSLKFYNQISHKIFLFFADFHQPLNSTGPEVDIDDDFFSFLYPYFLNKDPTSFGAWLVLMEMSLALVGIILNLAVLISIKEKESLANSTVTIVLANLCFANLVSGFFLLKTDVLCFVIGPLTQNSH
jgi:hypothetical protein